MERAALRGTFVPLVTPFDAEEAFDPAAMRRLIDFVLEQGASGVIATALTGEGPLLTPDETVAVWDVVFEQMASRPQIPVLTSVVTSTTRTAIQLVRRAESLGASAVMVAPVLPELYAGRSHDDVVRFYGDVADATPLPILLFNYPSLTGVDFVPALVERLCQFPQVQYIKESSGDIRRVHAIQRRLGERIQVVCGAPNVALESLALGCRAWITGIMNVVPRSCVQLVRAVHELSDLAMARRVYYEQILPVVDILVANFNPTGTIKAGVKSRGVDVGIPRRPGHDVTAEDHDALALLAKKVAHEEAFTAAEIRAEVNRRVLGSRKW